VQSKGLQLIAQFNFQRAPGGFTQKNSPAHGDKKPECRSSCFDSSDFLKSLRAKDWVSAADCQQLFLLPVSCGKWGPCDWRWSTASVGQRSPASMAKARWRHAPGLNPCATNCVTAKNKKSFTLSRRCCRRRHRLSRTRKPAHPCERRWLTFTLIGNIYSTKKSINKAVPLAAVRSNPSTANSRTGLNGLANSGSGLDSKISCPGLWPWSGSSIGLPPQVSPVVIDVTLFIQALGVGNLSYQWFFQRHEHDRSSHEFLAHTHKCPNCSIRPS